MKKNAETQLQLEPIDIQQEDKQYDYIDPYFTPLKNIIYRISIKGKRYYYELDVDGKTPLIYSSGTTLISDGYNDPSSALEHWKIQNALNGVDSEEVLMNRANYGTIMHILYGKFLMGVDIPLNNLDSFIMKLEDTHITPEDTLGLVENNLEEFQKDLLSFAQWVSDYNVKPLAIEMMMRSKNYKVATAIDLICELDLEEKGFFGEVYKSGEKKGTPKETKRSRRVVALVDFKSTKKGFYDKHALQLLLNRIIVNENYPQLKIEKLYNFAPNEWRTAPTYKFKDQTDSDLINELSSVIKVGMLRHNKRVSSSSRVITYNGTLNITKKFSSANYTNSISIVDTIMNYRKNKKK